MNKKIFTLLLALMCIASSAWATYGTRGGTKVTSTYYGGVYYDIYRDYSYTGTNANANQTKSFSGYTAVVTGVLSNWTSHSIGGTHETIGGYYISQYVLGEHFLSGSSCESLTVGYHVKLIEMFAFEDASDYQNDSKYHLKKVYFSVGEDVYVYRSTDGRGAFSYVPTLTEVTIDRDLKRPAGDEAENAGWGIFEGCESKNVKFKIGGWCHTIPGWCFKNIGGNSTVDLSGATSLTKICKEAFYGFSQYQTSIELPNSLTSIGENAFRDWFTLRSIHMGGRVTYVGSNAFGNDYFRLIWVHTDSGTPSAMDTNNPTNGVNWNNTTLVVDGPKASTYKALSPWKNAGDAKAYGTRKGFQKDYLVQDGIIFGRYKDYEYSHDGQTGYKEIGNSAVVLEIFKTGEVTIPNQVTISGYDCKVVALGSQCLAFNGGVTKLTIPYNVSTLESFAMEEVMTDASYRREPTIKEIVLIDGDKSLYCCRSSKKDGCPGSAFWWNKKLNKLYVGRTLQAASNDYGPFNKLTGLTNLDVTIGPRVTSIPTYCFNSMYVSNSAKLTFKDEPSNPSMLETIHLDAFCQFSDKLEEVSLPRGLKNLKRGAFYNLKGLKRMTIHDQLKEYGDYVFSNPDGKDNYFRVINVITTDNAVTDNISMGNTVFTNATYKGDNLSLNITGPKADKYKEDVEPWKNFYNQHADGLNFDLRRTCILDFKIDKAFNFTNNTGIGPGEEHPEYGDLLTPGTGVEYIDCPGVMSVAFVTWQDNSSGSDYLMKSMDLYLGDGDWNHSAHNLFLASFSGEGGPDNGAGIWNNEAVITGLTNYNGNKSAMVGRRWYKSHNWGMIVTYVVTRYSDDARKFIENHMTSDGQIELRAYTRWNGSDRTGHSVTIPVEHHKAGNPNLSGISLKTVDSKTAVAYTLKLNEGFEKYYVQASNGSPSKTGKVSVNASESEQNLKLKEYWNTLSTQDSKARKAFEAGTLRFDVTPYLKTTLPTYSDLTGTSLYMLDSLPSEVEFLGKQTYFYVPKLRIPENATTSVQGDGTINVELSYTDLNHGDNVDESPIYARRLVDNVDDNTVFTMNFDADEKTYSFQDFADTKYRNQGNKTFTYNVYRGSTPYSELITRNFSRTWEFSEANFANVSVKDNGDQTATLTWQTEGLLWTENTAYHIHYNNYDNQPTELIINKRDSCVAKLLLNACIKTNVTLQVIETIDGVDRLIDERTLENVSVTNSKKGEVHNLVISKGFYPGKVTLDWDVDKENNNFNKFVLRRREYGDAPDKGIIIETVNFVPTQYSYHYEDNSCLPGVYYIYTLEGQSQCEGDPEPIIPCSMEAIGFASQYGVVSGQVTYGSGQAVQGVRVVAQGEDQNLGFRSMYFDGSKSYAAITGEQATALIPSTTGTVDFYIRPTRFAGKQDIISAGARMQLHLQDSVLCLTQLDGKTYDVRVDLAKPTSYFNANKFNHVAITYGTDLCIYINGHLVYNGAKQASATVAEAPARLGAGTANKDYFQGHLDELRFWNIANDSATVVKMMDHVLIGNEEHLIGYYRCDDPIQGELYDISRTGVKYNQRHLTLNNVVFPMGEGNVPGMDQLALSGVTDESGIYLISAIPYGGDGSFYQIIPAFGIHEFSPSYRPIYFNQTTNTHNSIDFFDVSSFTVNGYVYYKGTNVPVEEVMLYIDGYPAAGGDHVLTDDNGYFEIEVPIGKHYISLNKKNHAFCGGGRYPADPKEQGTLFDFREPISDLVFYDSTLVCLTGRVAGGAEQAALPHGFNLGHANIGQAEVVIAPVNDKYDLNTDREHAVTWKTLGGCRATTAARVADAAKSVTILTDSATGEFSVMLPPIDFNVLSTHRVKENPSDIIQFDLGSFEKIELSGNMDSNLETDTLVHADGSVETFSYMGKLDIIHYATPTLDVTNPLNEKDSLILGDTELYVYTISHTGYDSIYTIPAYDKDSGYVLGAPVFREGLTYYWRMHAYERYVNYDGDTAIVEELPVANSLVTISNQLGIHNVISGDTTIYIGSDSVVYHSGDILTAVNSIQLDSTGVGYYIWSAGEPNLAGSHRLNATIYFTDSEQKYIYDWAENLRENGFEGIVLGTHPEGTQVFTAGPEDVEYILRDPIGVNSTATWNKSTTTTTTKSYETGFKIDTHLGFKTMFGTTIDEFEGVGTPLMVAEAKIDAKDVLYTNEDNHYKGTTKTVRNTSITTTENISTKSGGLYNGSTGDIYIGHSTNTSMGMSQSLHVQDVNGFVELVQESVFEIGSSYETEFFYTQRQLIETVIPNYIAARNQLITIVDSDTYNSFSSMINPGSEYIYISEITEDNPNFAQEGYYHAIEPAILPENTVAANMVQVYNSYIENWKKHIANNEKAKVQAKKLIRNVTLDGGASVSFSTGSGYHNEDQDHFHFEFEFKVQNDAHWVTWTGGISWEIGVMPGGTFDTIQGTTEDYKETLTYSMGLNSREQMSIDVLEAPDGFSPIFKVRGGQTYCPYQDEERTKFYYDSIAGEYPILHEKTVPMEVPQIRVVGKDAVNDVPVGGEAYFTIEMANATAIAGYDYMNLRLFEESNLNGAEVIVDGMPLSSAQRQYYFNNQNGEIETIRKTVTLRQGRKNVMDYPRIGLILSSDCGERVVADTCYISATFIPACPPADLTVETPLINQQTHSVLSYTISNYDINTDPDMLMRVEYKHNAEQNWHTVKSYSPAEMDGKPIYGKWDMSDMLDGQYDLRAVTTCNFTGDNVYNYGDPIRIIKDTVPATNLGLPSPINGIYTVDNQIYVDFNESIQPERIIRDNVTVEAVLNGHDIKHDVALEHPMAAQFYSEAAYNFLNTAFTFEGWFNLQKITLFGGGIFQHKWNAQDGFTENMLNLCINPDRRLALKLDNNLYESEADPLPLDEWFFLSFTYLPTSDSTAIISASYAADGRQVNLFDAEPVRAYYGRGSITLGALSEIRMHDVVLWNCARTWATAQSQMYQTKEMHAADIVSYWPMNEGKGDVAKDVVRHRNLVLSGSNWWFNNPNYALDLSNGQTATMNITHCPLGSTENYLLEFWFRSENDGVLMALGNKVKIASYEDNLVMLVGEAQHLLKVSHNLSDGQWHHFALQNQMGQPDVYIDGESCKIVAQGATSQAVECGSVTFGDDANTGAYAVDEVRLWKAFLSRDFMTLNMNNRLRGNEDGLVAYYPMEEYTLNEYNQWENHFSLVSQNTNDSIRNEENVRVVRRDTLSPLTLAESPFVPALLEARPKEGVNHTVTPSDSRLVINITESAQRIEGCTLEFTVRDIVDAHGNYSQPIHWTAYVNRNQLVWDENTLHISKTALTDTTFTVTIINNSGKVENWHLAGVPEWLTFSQTAGTLQPLQEQELTATISASLAIGEYEQSIYLYGNQNMDSPLYLTVKVNADAPAWKINAADYEYTMHLVARIRLNGALADDEEDMVAAFIGGKLAGVAHPKFYPSSNGYFVVMNIYQNFTTAQRDSINSGLPIANMGITFATWDASTGLIYKPMDVYEFVATNGTNKLTPVELQFAIGALKGNFTYPIELRTTDLVEQQLHLEKGWNWKSLNVLLTESDELNNIYTQFGDVMQDIEIIKTQNAFAQYDSVRNLLAGSLQKLPDLMVFKEKTTKAYVKSHYGHAIQPQFYGLELAAHSWTWIPYLPQMALSVNAALANLNPNAGDIVKSRSGFALYDGNEWLGSLDVMAPGEGYIYYNAGSQEEVLYYPSSHAVLNVAQRMPAMRVSKAATEVYTPCAPSLYQSNMTMTAIVLNGAEQVMNAEVGIFAGEECRGANMTDEYGYAFVTIAGDENVLLNIRVTTGGQEYLVKRTVNFVSDAILGTPNQPFIIQIGEEPEGFDNLQTGENGIEKFIRDGILYIQRGGITYTVMGKEVESKN